MDLANNLNISDNMKTMLGYGVLAVSVGTGIWYLISAGNNPWQRKRKYRILDNIFDSIVGNDYRRGEFNATITKPDSFKTTKRLIDMIYTREELNNALLRIGYYDYEVLHLPRDLKLELLSKHFIEEEKLGKGGGYMKKRGAAADDEKKPTRKIYKLMFRDPKFDSYGEYFPYHIRTYRNKSMFTNKVNHMKRLGWWHKTETIEY